MSNIHIAQAGHIRPRVARTPRVKGSRRRELSAGDIFKRSLDIMIAVTALIFVAPMMIIVALLVRMDGGPSLFGHSRVGEGGRAFKCLKFRSMVVDAEARLTELLATDPDARQEWALHHKLRHDPRVTPLGGFLRKSSLDELPQLINVLRGEMSVVGPRPIVSAEAEKYGRYLADYVSVRPGITGLWQVSGRSETTYRRRVALDVLYRRRWSPLLDIQILLKTVPAVLLSRGSC